MVVCLRIEWVEWMAKAAAKSKSIYETLQDYNPINRISKMIKPDPVEPTEEQKKKRRQEALMNPAKTSLAPSNSVVRKAAAKATK